MISIDDRSIIGSNGWAEAVTFTPGEVRCSDGAVTTIRLETPFPTSARRYAPVASDQAPVYRLGFAIDNAGRAHAIHRTGQNGAPIPLVDTSDLAPALAVSRFAPNAPHQMCEISYTVNRTAIAQAPLSLLYELASAPTPGSAIAEINDRLRQPGSDCARAPVSPRAIHYPAFETIDQPAGTRSWTYLGFDIDKKGRTANVRVLASSGNAALDRAGVKAVTANLYAPASPYRGCSFHFHRDGDGNQPAPALPPYSPDDNGDEISACAIDPKTIPGLLNGNAYPTGFSRRRIEGVAVIGYDTAPWGATGNVKVIAAEPDEAFGQSALAAMLNARVGESDSGHRGCVRRIRFVLPAARGTDRPRP